MGLLRPGKASLKRLREERRVAIYGRTLKLPVLKIILRILSRRGVCRVSPSLENPAKKRSAFVKVREKPKDKNEWIRYTSHGGGRPVWHLPQEDTSFKIYPLCKTNGPINGKVYSVCYVELVPSDGRVCRDCATRLMNRLKLTAEGALKRELIKLQVKEKVSVCRIVPIAKNK
jgi:hypothetical protein